MNTKHTLTFIVSLLLALCVHNSYSQSNGAEKKPVQWYQIEVFIFDNSNEAAAGNERWPQDLGLRYPQNTVKLRTALSQGPLSLEKENSASTNINSFKQFSGSSNGSEEGSNLSAITGSLQSGISIENSNGEIPYTLLPNEEIQLTRVVRNISRRNNFRTLFHHVWRQPAATRKDAPHIIITGGDKFDNYYELEGTIQLGVERYLHITTDLWLSNFVSNAGLERGLWSALPKRPEITKQGAKQDTFDPLQNSFLELFGNQYSVDRTVTMRQTRRMRSGELHYIDHPLIGLLVKVVPYDVPIEEK